MKNIYTKSILAALIFGASFSAQSQIISTLAGNGTGGYSGDAGQATAAELSRCAGVAVDAAGNVYVADFGNSRIRMINTSGTISTFAGNGTPGYSGDAGQATAAEINEAFGVGVDVSGNVYIADYMNNRIRKVNTSGIISTIAGNGTGGYSGDGGQATAAEINNSIDAETDGSGNVYIADYRNNRIRKINTSGIITTLAGNGTSGFSGDGGQATAAEINSPGGVSVDGSGNVYFADEGNNRVRKVNTLGIISTIGGNGTANYSGDGGQATAAELSAPYDVSLDATGNVYIADLSNSRIRMINTSGTISTFAGNGVAGFSGDGGQATAAEVQFPSSVTVDMSGNIYIGDENNNRVRKVTSIPSGINEILSVSNVEIYPNPTSAFFTIAGIAPGQTVELYNHVGQKISSTIAENSTIQFDLSTMANGIYLVRILSKDGNIVSAKKIVKAE
jgi:sugar lactone lactonase YvrE